MRVAVVNLTAGGLSGGYRKYLARLMPLMAADDRISSLTVFVPGATQSLDPGLDVRTWDAREPRRRFAGVVRDVAALMPDVVFVPTARHASFGSIPVVTMVRNMEPLTVPFGGNSWGEGLRNVGRAWAARRASRRADRVIAVSHHVRDFIVSRWAIDSARVGVVHHGVDPASAEGGPLRDARPTLFTAGSIRPARGMEDALRALALLPRDVRLVVAGEVDARCDGYAAGLHRLARALGVEDRVTWAGQLGTQQMAQAFRACTAFVMTSRAEACPNTALEAMSHGCATISVDREPMPEMFGDAALYYPPGDTATLSSRVNVVLADPAEHSRLGRAALRRSTVFTWEHTRDRTIEQLEQALR